MSKLLLDTNILVYAIDEDSDYFERARSVIENSEKTLLTTSKNLAEFLAVVTRSSAYDLEPQLALDILQEILQGVDVLFPDKSSMKIFLDLVQQYRPKGLKIHDYDIISIALANACSEIATFNSSDFKAVKEISLLNI